MPEVRNGNNGKKQNMELRMENRTKTQKQKVIRSFETDYDSKTLRLFDTETLGH